MNARRIEEDINKQFPDYDTFSDEEKTRVDAIKQRLRILRGIAN